MDGDEILIDIPMKVRCLSADVGVREDLGKVAFMRGPVCYCMEEADNGKNLHLLRADTERLSEITAESSRELGHEMRILRVPGKRLEEGPKGAGLYHEYVPAVESDAVLTFVPYYAWSNRGEGEMSVWVRG
ncbi:non-reducing end beta-L-arabinofuranosidase [Lachnospiraceae bacterium]|nr:non-reducing end beta-L-arabinofuranosidase [Lachnospiraceae bacterium]